MSAGNSTQSHGIAAVYGLDYGIRDTSVWLRQSARLGTAARSSTISDWVIVAFTPRPK